MGWTVIGILICGISVLYMMLTTGMARVFAAVLIAMIAAGMLVEPERILAQLGWDLKTYNIAIIVCALTLCVAGTWVRSRRGVRRFIRRHPRWF